MPWSSKDMCVQNTDQFVCAALGKPFKSNCSWRKVTGNHLHICTSHVYDDASAMAMSSRTCRRAENSSSSSSCDIRLMVLCRQLHTAFAFFCNQIIATIARSIGHRPSLYTSLHNPTNSIVP